MFRSCKNKILRFSPWQNKIKNERKEQSVNRHQQKHTFGVNEVINDSEDSPQIKLQGEKFVLSNG